MEDISEEVTVKLRPERKDGARPAKSQEKEVFEKRE